MKYNRWENDDRWATKCAKTALKSSEQWSIEDVCRELHIDIPITEQELLSFYNICRIWGIKHNMIEESFLV
jgi:hypothetical protein